jgi:hypothetical protein
MWRRRMVAAVAGGYRKPACKTRHAICQERRNDATRPMILEKARRYREATRRVARIEPSRNADHEVNRTACAVSCTTHEAHGFARSRGIGECASCDSHVAPTPWRALPPPFRLSRQLSDQSSVPLARSIEVPCPEMLSRASHVAGKSLQVLPRFAQHPDGVRPGPDQIAHRAMRDIPDRDRRQFTGAMRMEPLEFSVLL